MAGFFKKNGGWLRNLSFFSLLVIPFGLYGAALGNAAGLVYLLLGLMGLAMLLAMKVG